MRKDKALLKFLSNPAVIRRHYSPSISRTIPASSAGFHGFKLNEWFVVGLVSVILMYLIVMVSLQVNKQIIELGQKQARRSSIIQEKVYWEKITNDYPNYRDGFFHLALLEYQLGNAEAALMLVNKALYMDPRFEAGVSFREKITRE